MMMPTRTPMMIPIEPLVSTAAASVNSGGGGGATLAIEGEGGGGEGGGGGRGGRGGGAGQVETMPLTPPSVRAVGQKQTAVPPLASTFCPELAAVFPLMVHNEMVTEPPET